MTGVEPWLPLEALLKSCPFPPQGLDKGADSFCIINVVIVAVVIVVIKVCGL